MIVDVDVEDGQLSRVALSGDFFLEPDDALEDIVAAVTGLPTTADATRIGQAIAEKIGDDVALIGFTPNRSVSRSAERSATRPAGTTTPSTSSNRWCWTRRCTSRSTR